MRLQATTIEEFFTKSGERESELRQLDKLIQRTLPGIDRELSTGMSFVGLAYGKYHYKYASGREGDWYTIMLAPQKHYISLYVVAGDAESYLTEQYGKKLGRVNIGKSCIRFKTLDDLNLEQLASLLKEAGEWLAKQPKAKEG